MKSCEHSQYDPTTTEDCPICLRAEVERLRTEITEYKACGRELAEDLQIQVFRDLEPFQRWLAEQADKGIKRETPPDLTRYGPRKTGAARKTTVIPFAAVVARPGYIQLFAVSGSGWIVRTNDGGKWERTDVSVLVPEWL